MSKIKSKSSSGSFKSNQKYLQEKGAFLRVSNKVGAYPDQVPQSEGICFLYHRTSVMDDVQQRTHQFT